MNKKRIASCLLLCLTLNGFSQKGKVAQLSQLNADQNKNTISFTENKGQVVDQNYQPRPDVLFGGQNNGLVFHLRNNGISYQLNRIDKWKEASPKSANTRKLIPERKMIDKSTTYRVDINWLNSNMNTSIVREQELSGFSNFYTAEGAFTVKSYGEITYRNLYDGISLKWYQKDGELKYDYLCSAGSDYKKIKLQINGAKQLSLSLTGELIIKTPLGTIIEKAPLVMQGDKLLSSAWVLENNTLSFKINKLNNTLPYIIDPAVRVWGTYYGGNSFDAGNDCATDALGNVYMTGYTTLNTSTIIATIGSYQATFGGLGDAFLVKFNSSGVRLWSSYYGGANADNGTSLAVDGSGNVYMSGITSSTAGIASAAAHQTVMGNSSSDDAFLVKFDGAGLRQWATYYGGSGNEENSNCTVDPSGNVYLVGTTESATGTVIATATSQQPTFGGSLNDAYLVKFNSSGVRQWATYYGGTGLDYGYACSADAVSVYLGGVTSSTSAAIATGGHQNTHGGGFYDAYLVKFSNSTGIRTWGTFYGGSGSETGYSCAADASGNVYLSGVTTTSLTGVMATAASHQSVGVTAFDNDAFLVKFNGSGVRQWATYYGGDDADDGYGCATDASNNVYLVGTTSSTLSSAIATSGSYQTNLGAAFATNAYIAKFDASGVRQWGTYYGVDSENGTSATSDGSGNVYMTGVTSSTLTGVIASAGSHQTTYGGGSSLADAFLVKFSGCSAASPVNATIPANQSICSGNSSTLSATSGTTLISWYATSASTTVIGTGTTYVTSNTLTTGTYTFYAEGGTCASGSLRTGITLTVGATPIVSAAGGTICSGKTFSIVPSGAATYSVVDQNNQIITQTGVNFLVTPLTSFGYFYIGTAVNGCVSQVGSLNITVNASPTVSAANGTICSGASFTIAPNGANSYTIQGGSAIVSPVSSSNYTVIGSNTNGCVSISPTTISVIVQNSPTIGVASGTVCKGASFTIVPIGASSFTVQGGNSVVSPTSNMSFTVIGTTLAGCLAQNVATCFVTVLANPTVTAANGNICAGQSFTILPTGALTYTIFETATNTITPTAGAYVVSPLTPTSYFLVGTSANGCISGVSLVNVDVTSINISVNSGTICSGKSFTISPTGASTYTLQGGINVVSPLSSTNYTLAGTDASGCIGFATSSVVIDASKISVNSGSICPGSSFTIAPNGVSSFTVEGGKAVVSPTANSTYTVKGITTAGCVIANVATCSVVVIKLPEIALPRVINAPLLNVHEYRESLNYIYATYSQNNISFAKVEPATGYIKLHPSIPSEIDVYFSPVFITIYTLTISYPEAKNCSTNFTLQVNGDDLTKGWILPNVITVNGDGKNDYWLPSFRESYIFTSPHLVDVIKSLKITNVMTKEIVVNNTRTNPQGGVSPYLSSLGHWNPDPATLPKGTSWYYAVLTLANDKTIDTFITVTTPK